MNKKKLRLGLVGKDVSKSLSEDMHRFILQSMDVDCEYEKFSITADEFDGVMRRLLGDFDGFNVTIPYKRDVMGYLDEMVGDALDFGAVNTIVSATATGYNTDGIGFLQMLSAADISVENKKILVLGGGGAGRSTAATLKRAGARVFVYQRNREKLEEVCRQLGVTAADRADCGGFDILVNCTGVGMHESVGRSPVTDAAFTGAEAAVDLIYEPQETEFLRQAKKLGLKTLNGEAMLFYQAYYADCLYLDIRSDAAQAESLYRKYKNR